MCELFITKVSDNLSDLRSHRLEGHLESERSRHPVVFVSNEIDLIIMSKSHCVYLIMNFLTSNSATPLDLTAGQPCPFNHYKYPDRCSEYWENPTGSKFSLSLILN